MDDLRDEFQNNKGTYLTCGVLTLLSILGGTIAILGPRIGEGRAALLGFGLIVFVVLMILGVAKGMRAVKIISGVLLMPLGLGVMGFVLYDFVKSLGGGESIMNRGLSAGNYGTQMFILTAVGFGIFGLGLILLGIIKTD